MQINESLLSKNVGTSNCVLCEFSLVRSGKVNKNSEKSLFFCLELLLYVNNFKSKPFKRETHFIRVLFRVKYHYLYVKKRDLCKLEIGNGAFFFKKIAVIISPKVRIIPWPVWTLYIHFKNCFVHQYPLVEKGYVMLLPLGAKG